MLSVYMSYMIGGVIGENDLKEKLRGLTKVSALKESFWNRELSIVLTCKV